MSSTVGKLLKALCKEQELDQFTAELCQYIL